MAIAPLPGDRSAEVDDALHADVPAPSAAMVAQDVSLGVESDGIGRVLRVQLHNLDRPKWLAVAGGPAASTDSAGIARLRLPLDAERVELTIAEVPTGQTSPFLRIVFDEDFDITSFSRLLPSDAVEHRRMESLASSLDGPMGGALASVMSETGLASFSGHHADGFVSVVTPAGFSRTAGGAARLQSDEKQSHPHGAGPAGANSATSGETPSATAAANVIGPNVSPGMTLFASLQHKMDVSQSPMAERALPLTGESVDPLFADWSDEEVVTAAIVELATGGLKPLHDQPAGMSSILAIPLLATEVDIAAQLTIRAEPTEVSRSWMFSASIFIAALSAVGAIWLERRSQQVARTSPERGNPLAPASISADGIAKAAG